MTKEHAVARRVALGTATNVIGQAVVLITLLAAAPIIVHAVGATDFGVWVVVGSVASFALLLDLGISSGLVKYVAQHAALGEIQEAAAMVAAATWLYCLLGATVLAGGLLVAFALPELVALHGAFARLLPPLASLTAVDVAISIVAVTPLAVLRGLQRFPAVNLVNGAGAVTGLLLTIIVLVAGAGIVGVAAVGAFNSALTYLASMVLARRIARGYLSGRPHRDRERARRLLRFSRSIAAIQVAIRLQSRADAVIIGVALPVRFVTPYNFAQRLATGTSIAGDQFGRVLLPLATEMGSGQDPAVLRRLFLAAIRLSLGIALGVGLPIAILGGHILSLWVGPQYAAYGIVVLLLAVAAIIDLPSGPAGYVLQSIERHQPVAWMAVGGGLANVGISIALVGRYGINGVAAGTLIATAVEITLFVIPYAARVLGVSAREFMAEVIAPLFLPAVVLGGILVGGDSLLALGSALYLALVIGAGLLVYTATYIAVGARAAERSAYRAATAAVLRLPGRMRGARPS
jgi:O-antigen/teichoic acid export membrane protein